MKLKILQKKIFLIIVPFILLISFFVLYYALINSEIFTVVDGRIYRSAQPSGGTLEKFINKKGIKSIINLRGKCEDSQWYIEESEISKKYHVSLYDVATPTHDLPKYRVLINILDILLTSEKPILIHCHRGVDRTGMVSALALAIEQDPPLSEIKNQFSWRYGVLPFYRSIGPYLFSKYEQWLEKTHRIHSKNNLIYWITHEYIDSQGNLEFYIDSVNSIVYDEDANNKIVIPDNSKYTLIEGWAFDARTNSPVENLYVVIDNRTSLKVNYKYNRPDVAKHFDLGEKYYKKFMVGWKVSFDRAGIADGCHNIYLKYVEDKSNTWDIPTRNTFCFKNTF